MKRKDMLEGLDKLNHHYGLRIGWQNKHGHNTEGPVAAYSSNSIWCPRNKVLYDLRVLAHEYAHFLCPTLANFFSWDKMHNAEFEATYIECCFILGVCPIPTKKFTQIKKAEFLQTKRKVC